MSHKIMGHSFFYGWTLIDTVIVNQNKVRHENRSLGVVKRKNYEEIQVFVK